MKNFFLILFILTCFALSRTSKVYSQANVIKINPLSIVVLTPNIKYERRITPALSAQLGVHYTNFSFRLDDSGKLGYSGIGITPEIRYYFFNSKFPSPKGLFAGPYFRYTTLNFKYKYDDMLSPDEFLNTSSIGGGIIVGYQFIFAEVFSLEGFGGPGYRNRNITATTGDITEEDIWGVGLGSGLNLRLGITLGAAF